MILTDVTVREASQMPGRSYSADQRIQAGLAIDRLGVDRIQAGFPVTGEVDQEVTRELAARADAEIGAIARALPGDVEAALDADAEAVEVFAPFNDHHLEHDLGKPREEVLEMVESAVGTLLDGGVRVRVAVLDAFRTDHEHLATVAERFGDDATVGLADTVGCRSPKTVRETLDRLSAVVDLDRVSVHFHNDLGVGTANVLAAYECGVANADVAIAALGERVGNPALEEVVATGDLEYDDSFGVDPGRLVPVAEDVLAALGEEVSERKPVLGREATTHEAGLHTAAMLDEPSLFEPFDPARFGGKRTLVFGEGTGRGGARILRPRAGAAPTEETAAEPGAPRAARGPMDQDEATELAREEL